MITTDLAGITHPGKHRTENQDTFYISADKRLMVVADGLNKAHPEAEASQLVVETLCSLWTSSGSDLTNDASVREWLQASIKHANEVIRKISSEDAKRIGASTIVAAVQTEHGKIHIAHVGDSRAYVMKDGVLQVLTEDHTFLNHMKKTNPEVYEQITTQKVHACYTVDLWRLLGCKKEVSIDSTEIDLSDGDWLLLCSDGLYDYISDESIAGTLATFTTANGACEQLLAEVMEVGAFDDVTIVSLHM